MANVLMAIESTVKHSTLTISIAAGVKIAEIATALVDKPIIRVMPIRGSDCEGASAMFATTGKAYDGQGNENILIRWQGGLLSITRI